MRRLVATLRHDARLQARHWIYVVVVAVSVILPLALRVFFEPAQLQFFMPLLALAGVNVTAFFLVAMLLIRQRDEGTLNVLLVTPLRPAEFLASKVITLALLALVEGFLIAGLAYGLDFVVPWLVLAVLQRAALGVALGVALAVRFPSITRFLMPAILVMLTLDLPVLWYLGVLESPIFFAGPTMPSLILAQAAFVDGGATPVHLAYALIYGPLVVVAALVWAARSLDRFVVRAEAVS